MNVKNLNLAALKNFDFTKFVPFLKRRGVLIGAVLAIVVAPLAGWWFRGGITDSIVETMAQRSKEYDKIIKLGTTSITIRSASGEAESKTESVSLNPTLIEALSERNKILDSEVTKIYQSAVEHNKKNHVIIQMKDNKVVFPKPEQNDALLLDEIFLTQIGSAYEALLTENRTGQPPDPLAVLEAVQRRSGDYILNDLKKKSLSEVTDPKELADLNAALRGARLASLDTKAREIAIYLDANAIRMPPTQGPINLTRCFVWQWDLWVLQDIFRAIASSNSNMNDGVISASVKRIMSIQIFSIAAAAKEGPTAEAEPEPTEEPKETSESPSTTATELTGVAIAPKTAIVPDYSASLTGLKSCQLYDVRNVKLKLIVAAADMTKVFNAFAKENFMTVTQVKFQPVDIFQAARLGYIYGKDPCSEVTMILQSIWMREWTTLKMPVNLKNLIGTRGVEIPMPMETAQPKEESQAPREEPKS
ncbi:MAG: hypothetical protein EXS12_07430 [Phycisphaerales bacterium]|nr:hypothetical protein [Phycisphaerales bacterium]